MSASSELFQESQLRSDGPEKPLSVQEVILQNHDALLHFLKRRLRVPEDALDIAQETYIRMMQYESSREIQSPASMLYRIAMNVTRDFSRAAQSRGAASQCDIADLQLSSEQPSPEREVSGGQELELLLAAIEELPPKCRNVFLLSRVHHLTYAEIAVRCNISVKMVEKHISHALEICVGKVGGSAGGPS